MTYWSDIYNLKELPDIIINNVDWEKVGWEKVREDGWENVNGEYQYIGEYDGQSYYANWVGSGSALRHQDMKVYFLTKQTIERLGKLDKIPRDFKSMTKTQKKNYEDAKKWIEYAPRADDLKELIPFIKEEDWEGMREITFGEKEEE